MHTPYQSITINGIPHSRQALNLLIKAYSSEIAVAGWEKKLFDFIDQWLSDDAAIPIQTSGSTGKPAIFLAEKKKMVQSALRTGRFLDLQPGDKALLALPVSFIAGKMMVVRAFVLGLDLIPVNPTSNPLAGLDQSIDFAAITPMQLHHALESQQGTDAVNSIRTCIVGGGDIDQQLLLKIKKLNTELWHTYGMTETLTHVAMKKLSGKNQSTHFEALPEIKFTQDQRGCLEISAPWLSNEKIVTNDLVHLLDEHRFNFIGRWDNIINTGGIKISPEIVESKLAGLFTERFVILGLPDPVLGQKIVLVVEGNKQNEKSCIDTLNSAGLSNFERPKEIRFLYQFPLTDSGKVIRSAVLEHLLNQ